MRIFTCNNHDGHWGVPVASVIVAASEDEARSLLDTELAAHRLKPGTGTLEELDATQPQVRMLSDGDY